MPSASNGLPLIVRLLPEHLESHTSLGMNDAVADPYFLVFVHERFRDIRIMPVFDCRPADKRRPIRNRLLL